VTPDYGQQMDLLVVYHVTMVTSVLLDLPHPRLVNQNALRVHGVMVNPCISAPQALMETLPVQLANYMAAFLVLIRTIAQ